jgi:DNA-binding GntR family transcriptional regulator
MKRVRTFQPDVSQVERVYGEVRSRILDGRYRPGAPLSEVMLARTHGTSRTPVREVLSRLLQENWVERVPNRGYFVARLTLRVVQEAFEVRRLLEGAAAAGAARHADVGDIDRLRRLAAVNTDITGANFRRAEAANREFHQAIAAASHNRMAADLIAHCMAQMDRVLALGVNARPLQQGTRDEHIAIVEAITRHDPAAARQSMEDHLDRCQELLRRALFQGAVEDVGA